MAELTAAQRPVIKCVPLRHDGAGGDSFGVCPFCGRVVIEERWSETRCEHYVNTGSDDEQDGPYHAFRGRAGC